MPDASRDIDGRRRIPFNVFTSWAAQGVQIVSGFIVPRLIDNRLGQEALGVWDLAWSIVSYFSLVQAGVVSSINRYVAMHRASGDTQSVSRVVSSVTTILVVMGAVVMGMTLLCAFGVGHFLDAQLAEHVPEARRLVFLLGTCIAIQIAFSAFGGVLTGCHRWDLHNATYAGCYAMTLAGMITVLATGGGLVGLAVVVLAAEVVGKAVRWALAYRVCPGLQLRPGHVSWHTARDLLGFGGKSFIPQLADILLNQTVNIMIVVYMGPATLALYARPRALVRHVRTLMQKYAFVLVPTTSSLQSCRQQGELQDLLVKATRYGACICLPILLLLTIMGGELLQVWMGDKYQNAPLVAVLTLGHAAYIAYMPLYYILSGLNLHGRPGIAMLGACILALGLSYVALAVFNAGLVVVAAVIGLAFTLVHGIYLPVYACRRLELPLSAFLARSWRTPAACVLPYAACLYAAHRFLGHSPVVALCAGCGSGGLALLLTYWLWIVPESWRKRLWKNAA
jgi:O-antigen/teichoic acid export membrane protein